MYTFPSSREKEGILFLGEFLYWCIYFNHSLGQKYYTLTYFRRDTYLKGVLKSHDKTISFWTFWLRHNIATLKCLILNWLETVLQVILQEMVFPC